MTQTCTPGSPTLTGPMTVTATWQRLTVGQRSGWVGVARATVPGEADYYWGGDAHPDVLVDGLEFPALRTGKPMASLVATYATPEAVVTAWQCHVDGLRRVGSAPPAYRIEPYALIRITDRGAVPGWTPR